jgi:hypothetical protein
MSASTLIERPHPPTSPLILSDRLLTLAEAADRAGFADTAEDLVRLAHKVFDEQQKGGPRKHDA